MRGQYCDKLANQRPADRTLLLLLPQWVSGDGYLCNNVVIPFPVRLITRARALSRYWRFQNWFLKESQSLSTYWYSSPNSIRKHELVKKKEECNENSHWQQKTVSPFMRRTAPTNDGGWPLPIDLRLPFGCWLTALAHASMLAAHYADRVIIVNIWTYWAEARTQQMAS